MTATSPAILGYRRFLEERDGTPDLYGDTLSRREEFYRRIESEPLRSRWVPDRATFLRNAARARPEPGLDARMIWLLATAKANQAERFGVELGKLYGRIPDEDDEPEHVHVLLQETYHTRTLADVVGIFGLPVPRRPPSRATRCLIRAMVFNPLPRRFVLPLVGLSEMLGCVMFRLLRDRGIELFAEEPAVAARIRVLFDEILADEICHVGLVEAQLGRTGRSVVGTLYRGVGRRLPARLAPEYAAAVGNERLDAAFAMRFDTRAWAAEFPETSYAFG